MTTELVVMYDSPEAARKVGMFQGDKEISTGWLSIDNHFFNKEEMARYQSHTHKVCGCGGLMKKGWLLCESCRAKKRRDAYNKMPVKVWEKGDYAVLFADDKYFSSQDDFLEWCGDNDLDPKQQKLLLCKPQYLNEISSEFWDDVLPEDGDLPDDVGHGLREFNKIIRKQGPVSYIPGDTRLILSQKRINSIINKTENMSKKTTPKKPIRWKEGKMFLKPNNQYIMLGKELHEFGHYKTSDGGLIGNVFEYIVTIGLPWHIILKEE